MKRLIDIQCSECEFVERDVWMEHGEKYGVCQCGAPLTRSWAKQYNGAAHGDDIPGGLAVPHAICHPDGTPRVFYSKKEIIETARREGWTNQVEHIPVKGTDKSPHTVRWV